MASLTKKAIRSSFWKLLNQRPISQITVRDIVEDCGVNRNTFYYHFQDIPQLVETIVNDAADQMIRAYPTVDSLEACLNAAISFALENRRAVLHIYRSANRDLYEQYQWRVCEHAVAAYLDGVLAGKAVSPSDRRLLAGYLKCLSFGLILGWLETGMQEDIRASFRRLCALKHGELEAMIARCGE